MEEIPTNIYKFGQAVNWKLEGAYNNIFDKISEISLRSKY